MQPGDLVLPVLLATLFVAGCVLLGVIAALMVRHERRRRAEEAQRERGDGHHPLPR